jgi:hypothetical protein
MRLATGPFASTENSALELHAAAHQYDLAVLTCVVYDIIVALVEADLPPARRSPCSQSVTTLN